MERQRHHQWRMLAAAGAGATCMYLFDPRTGARRRALIRARLVRSARRIQDGMATTWGDARNRGQGLLAEVKALFDRRLVDDTILVERVRAKLGGLVRYPRYIEVEAEQGRVVLRGRILSGEVDRLLDGVGRVNGVKDVENRLELHEKLRDVPGLQGDHGHVLGGDRFELRQENWSPTARTSVGLAGTALAVHGIMRRDISGMVLAGLGSGAVLRAFVNRPWKQIIGLWAGHRAVDVNKTIRFAAPIENVFAFWARYAEFPQYTTHVREVLEQGERRSRWRVIGPAGIETVWNAVITTYVPNREIAWRTEPDSLVQHAGVLKFHDNEDGTTTMHLRITYNPVAGIIGHGIARLIGGDFKTLLEEDLLRIKTVLDDGVIPRDVQQRASQPKTEQFERYTTD